LAEYIFALPPYEEQVRISRLLEAQNTHIANEEAQLNKLRQIKQGLMHDLLTGEVRVIQLETVWENLVV